MLLILLSNKSNLLTVALLSRETGVNHSRLLFVKSDKSDLLVITLF